MFLPSFVLTLYHASQTQCSSLPLPFLPNSIPFLRSHFASHHNIPLITRRDTAYMFVYTDPYRQAPSDNRMEPPYGRHNNEYDPSAQAVPSQAGINPISPVSPNQRTGTPTMPMDSRGPSQQPMQFSNSTPQQQTIGVANGNGEFEEPRRNKFLDILCCRMH